ncbi:hypothetical protein [Clostridium intestinale]|jgi:hypothetical protein|uniref:YopX protein domain-containing protein n=1 Tax=Clostridium intestinale TaxID=36845 RepID=A0A7D6ZZX2_9CLOT|nr:hypothetical protein [Clostridium intestinale]QLY81502.1 hypothetical protein HZF06_07930 [Clostridium intestinale]
MKSNIFAIYKGKEYPAGISADGRFVLRSDDENDMNYGFTNNTGINRTVKCFKYVLKSELDEVYRKNTKAEYCGYEFGVVDEFENMLLIYAMSGDYRIWLQLGMECVDKGIYQKWVEKKDVIVKVDKEVL